MKKGAFAPSGICRVANPHKNETTPLLRKPLMEQIRLSQRQK